MVTNFTSFQKSLVMRIRIAYKMNNKDVLEEGQISNFPRGLWGWVVFIDGKNGDAQVYVFLLAVHDVSGVFSLKNCSIWGGMSCGNWDWFCLKYVVYPMARYLPCPTFFFPLYLVYVHYLSSSCTKLWELNFAYDAQEEGASCMLRSWGHSCLLFSLDLLASLIVWDHSCWESNWIANQLYINVTIFINVIIEGLFCLLFSFPCTPSVNC